MYCNQTGINHRPSIKKVDGAPASAHSGATKGGLEGAQAPPQPKLGPSCNSSRSDDFLYGVGGYVRLLPVDACRGLPIVLPSGQSTTVLKIKKSLWLFILCIMPNQGKGLSSVDSYENP